MAAVELEIDGMEAFTRTPGERARTLGTLSRAGRGGWSTTQPQELRRLLSLCRGEGETVCCVSHVASEPSSRAVERRLRLVVGVDGPSSGLIPTGGVSRRKASLASASEA